MGVCAIIFLHRAFQRDLGKVSLFKARQGLGGAVVRGAGATRLEPFSIHDNSQT